MLATICAPGDGLQPVFDLARLQPLGAELVRRYRRLLAPDPLPGDRGRRG